jgi:hypothetical protein
MNLRKGDAGKVFMTPSGRRAVYVKEHGGVYMFAYEDDPTDGLALSPEGLRILERAPAFPVAAAPRTGPVGVV